MIKDCSNNSIAQAKLARQLYPNQPKNLVAVTGTNGKTSVSWFYQKIIELIGYKSAAIGTIGVIANIAESHLATNLTENMVTLGLTTPFPSDLHKILDYFSDHGLEYVAMEASSHGLNEFRLSAVDLKAAAFTNFTQDHLDYHLNMEEYFQAKSKLFEEVLPAYGHAIINNDQEELDPINRICLSRNHKIIKYGKIDADILFEKGEGASLIFKIFDKKYFTEFNPIGEFQIYNLMAAIGLLIACDIEINQIISVIPSLTAPWGRMEWVGSYNNADIYIDFAHTPDALEKALKALPYSADENRKVHLVFGCAGKSDKTKRPLMGKVAQTYADIVIVTDDNPYFEEASTIRSEILKGSPNAVEIPGRGNAIIQAIKNLSPNDVLLITGKGHEQYQIIGDTRLKFSDQQQVKLAITNLLNQI
jgi:UDP-N-acetylmuramoyl-L-alanyl-D-glutamate--2,6-diaminopimelate ligase